MSSRASSKEEWRGGKDRRMTQKMEDVDPMVEKVELTLRNAGAHPHGMRHSEEQSTTMKALLHQYTTSMTLAEVDSDGEHPLFPTAGRDKGRDRARKSGVCQAVDEHGQGAALSPSQALLRSLVQNMDTSRLPHIRDLFVQKDEDALGADDFVAVLRGHVGLVRGADDREVSDELRKLHARLARGGAEAAEGDDVDIEADGAEGTESGSGNEAMEATVTWVVFARLLLNLGVVADVMNSFNFVKVLSHIDLERIAPLRDEFMQRGNSLNLETFIITLKGQFHYMFELTGLFGLIKEERCLIGQLIDLFEMIDIDGRSCISWEVFTAFLVDQGMSPDVRVEFNTIRFTASAVRDELMHQSHCDKAIYLKGFDKVAYVEQGSRVLKLVNPDMTPVGELNDFAQAPLAAVYIERDMVLVVSSSDLCISFYDANNGLKLIRRVKTRTAQLVMCWSEVAQVLYSADYEGTIWAWDASKALSAAAARAYEPGVGDSSKVMELDRQVLPMRHMATAEDSPRQVSKSTRGGSKTPRTDKASSNRGETIVMALLELPVLGLMASCGVDKNVMLWDVQTGSHKGTLRGHEMGVRCMAFAMSSKVLITGGYDYKLMVWNPYVSKFIHTIHSHNAAIVGVEVIGALSNQILSADAEGILKTWDLGTCQCIQTIVVSDCITMRCLISVPGHARIFAVDRRFVAYDYLNIGNADQTDESPIIKAIYVPRLKVIISGSTSHLRIWDAVTGAVGCVIEHKESEITDFCVDDRGRKVCIADHDGNICVHSTATGCFIKKLTAHGEEVSGMVYCPGDRNLITVSWDRTLLVHDESQQEPKVWRRATGVHAGDISCVAFSRALGLVATGATDCVISVREYERLRTLSSLVGHKSDLTALAFVDEAALLVSADLGGNVAIWAVRRPSGPPHKHQDQVLTRFVNMQSLESAASVNCLEPVYEAPAQPGQTFHLTAGEESHGSLVLYTGDEDGDVRVWEVSQLLAAAKISPCQPQKDWDPFKKDLIDCAHAAEAVAKKATALETPELPIQIGQPCVRQLQSWRAHGDSIRSLRVYNSIDVVISAGYDNMVKIWGRDGQMMTVLRAYGSIPWRFPVKSDSLGIEEGALDEIIRRVELEERALERRAREMARRGRLEN